VDAQIRDFLSKARQLDKEAREKIHELNRKIAHFAMGHQLEDLKGEGIGRTPASPTISPSWRRISWGTSRNFLGQTPELPFPIEGMGQGKFFSRRYRGERPGGQLRNTKGGPVVEEANPTYNNLVGRIERKAVSACPTPIS